MVDFSIPWSVNLGDSNCPGAWVIDLDHIAGLKGPLIKNICDNISIKLYFVSQSQAYYGR